MTDFDFVQVFNTGEDLMKEAASFFVLESLFLNYVVK